ncbi:Arv1-like protein [Lepidopterella palustris CBS 459.81]|uniref:Protein ARV n=1 Tax=Lepidopterella palustris CBS 459.81 TaxID=1314670 RepID=A0A8E2DY66_9PEZI|nr:Arv1-like protein [Lepidopterella palustris CBS 459.81]
MPICIECRYPVKTLYTTYSKADDRSLGKGVRLTQCPRCKRFADKYVEHDFVVLFIDLVLIKPQVYRHLLFNRLGREDDRFDRSIIRLGILLLLFDVYLTWARIEKLSTPIPSTPPTTCNTTATTTTTTTTTTPPLTNATLLSTQPLVLQYLFFLLLVTLSTLSFHAPIRLLCAHPPRLPPRLRPLLPSSLTTHLRPIIPSYPHPIPLSTALLVSSCTKLFPILLIIWEYDLPSSASAVSWAVIVNNIAALEILMDCGYMRAGLLVAVGAGVRALVAGLVLRAVGLGGAGGWRAELGLVGWGSQC